MNELIKVLGCEAIRVRKIKGDRKPAVSGKYLLIAGFHLFLFQAHWYLHIVKQTLNEK